MSFGKLILTPPTGPRQEFALAKGTVTIGRATNSDIALEDYRVSRNDCAWFRVLLRKSPALESY
jgi:hypothetical protein